MITNCTCASLAGIIFINISLLNTVESHKWTWSWPNTAY